MPTCWYIDKQKIKEKADLQTLVERVGKYKAMCKANYEALEESLDYKVLDAIIKSKSNFTATDIRDKILTDLGAIKKVDYIPENHFNIDKNANNLRDKITVIFKEVFLKKNIIKVENKKKNSTEYSLVFNDKNAGYIEKHYNNLAQAYVSAGGNSIQRVVTLRKREAESSTQELEGSTKKPKKAITEENEEISYTSIMLELGKSPKVPSEQMKYEDDCAVLAKELAFMLELFENNKFGNEGLDNMLGEAIKSIELTLENYINTSDLAASLEELACIKMVYSELEKNLLIEIEKNKQTANPPNITRVVAPQNNTQPPQCKR